MKRLGWRELWVGAVVGLAALYGVPSVEMRAHTERGLFERLDQGGHRARFQSAGYSATIEREVAEVRRRGRLPLRVELAAHGCIGAMNRTDAKNDMVRRDAEVLESDWHDGVRSWFSIHEDGLEFGYDVLEAASCDGMLRLELADTDGLEPEGTSDRVTFRDATGAAQWAMRELVAVGADGTALPSEFSYDDGALAMVVDIRGATWPVIVDPLIVLPTWDVDHSPEGDDTIHMSGMGRAVALNDDGSWAIVGFPYANRAEHYRAGAAIVYERDVVSGQWHESATLLGFADSVAPSYGVPAYFGDSVDISADGTRVIVGEPGRFNANGAGTAYIFERNPMTGEWSEEARLTSSDGGTYDEFGANVSITPSGDRVLIGALHNRGGGVYNSGAAYVFGRDPSTGDWTEEAKLVASDGAEHDNFGASVALDADGDLAMVGADGAFAVPFAKLGAVHAYSRDPSTGLWSEVAKITASDGASNDLFGHAMSLSDSGLQVLIGAPGSIDLLGGADGAAYLFERDSMAGTWTEVALLRAPAGAVENPFGESVSLSSDGLRALVGADDGDPDGPGLKRAAHIFEPDEVTGEWALASSLSAGAASGVVFGDSVALSGSGEWALVGDPLMDTDPLNGVGAAVVFARDEVATTWAEAGQLAVAEGRAGDGFGYAVSLSRDGNRALIGADAQNASGVRNAGTAHVYELDSMTWSWVSIAELTPSDAVSPDRFARSVSLSGDGRRALVGEPDRNAGGVNQSGAAYIYEPNGETDDWSEVAILVASDSQRSEFVGQSVSLSDDGNRAVIGAPGHHGVDLQGVGALYVYDRDAMTGLWSESAMLSASDGSAWAELGSSVALSRDGLRVLAGAPRQRVNGRRDGAAYLFEFDPANDTWNEIAIFEAADGERDDYFGNSVDLNGDGRRVLIAADRHAGAEVDLSGAAYVYEYDATLEQWLEVAELIPSDPKWGANFGKSVELNRRGDRALVGSPFGAESAVPENRYFGSGASYLFVRDEASGLWSEAFKVMPSSRERYANHGFAVSLDDDGFGALVGRPGLHAESGGVSIYRLPSSDWDMDGFPDDTDNCPGIPNIDQADADMDALGDVCDPCLEDSDADGVCDSMDACPGFDDSRDADADGTPDDCDPYPLNGSDEPDDNGIGDSPPTAAGGCACELTPRPGEDSARARGWSLFLGLVAILMLGRRRRRLGGRARCRVTRKAARRFDPGFAERK